jgi:hypothetical protein
MRSFTLLVVTALALFGLVASGLVLPARASAYTIAVEPQTVDVKVGSDFDVTISMRNMQYMIGFIFTITWDTKLMDYVSRTLLFPLGWSATLETVTKGTYTLEAHGAQFTGDASWVSLTFRCSGAGSSQISIAPYPESKWENPSTWTRFDVVQGGTCNQQAVAVGGAVYDVDTSALLSSRLLAVISLVGCMATAAVVAKKREK